MAKRKAKVNFIRRKGKKLFGAAKDKVLEAEKNRARSRNAKKSATTRRSRNRLSSKQQLTKLASIAGGDRVTQAIDLLSNGRRSKNVQEGFMAGGVFHPIRRSDDYSPARAGEKKPDRRTRTGKAGATRSRRGAALRASESVQRRTRRQRGSHNNPAALVLVNGAARRGKRGRRRRNSDDLYTGFHGHESTADVQVFGPDGTPNDLVMLGKLDEIFYSPDGSSTAKGLTNDCLAFSEMGHKRCRLASNRAGNKYYIVALTPESLPRYTPNGEFGFATRVTYQARKDHIEGDDREHGYWHKLGEENGICPRLCTDAEGFLVFRGGDYRTEPDGIIN